MVREIVPILRDTEVIYSLILRSEFIHKLLADGYLFISANLPPPTSRHHFPVFLCYGQGHPKTTLALFAGSMTNTLSPATFCTLHSTMVVPYQHHIKAWDPFGNIHRGIFHHLSQHVAPDFPA